jgi:hypothetical protein
MQQIDYKVDQMQQIDCKVDQMQQIDCKVVQSRICYYQKIIVRGDI